MTARHFLDQIERGLDGVTPGPWAVDGYSTDAVIYMPTGESHVSQWKHLAKCGTAEGHWRHNAAHIARCSPDAIREIAAYVRDLEERLAKAAEALEQIADLTARCEHDGGFDREIGPIGCNLGDKCLCIGLHPIARTALSQIRSEK